MLDNVTIIIPVAPDEHAHKAVLDDLKNTQAEVILSSEGSRAKSLNMGADRAQHNILWFVHADSRINADNLSKLNQSLQHNPDSLHYFDLQFDGGGLVALNALGANIRSRILATPYGDQGLCISKSQFEKAGRYPEDVPYAEDLLFVWQARHAGIKLHPVGSKLLTSARKYKVKGWLKLTLLYQWVWLKISVPQACKLLRGRK